MEAREEENASISSRYISNLSAFPPLRETYQEYADSALYPIRSADLYRERRFSFYIHLRLFLSLFSGLSLSSFSSGAIPLLVGRSSCLAINNSTPRTSQLHTNSSPPKEAPRRRPSLSHLNWITVLSLRCRGGSGFLPIMPPSPFYPFFGCALQTYSLRRFLLFFHRDD